MKRTALLLLLMLPLGLRAADGYVFSYFTQNGKGNILGETSGLRLAWSRDAISWHLVNGGEPVLQPVQSKNFGLMRDPSICAGPDGTYHLVWTCSWRSDNIGYAHSKDLLHWSEPRLIEVMKDIPGTRNCWAPEVTYNPDDGRFYIYWASTAPGHSPIQSPEKEQYLNHRIYRTSTTDFETFAPTRLWFNPPFSVIDAAVVQDPVKKDWIFFAKNENHTPLMKQLFCLRFPSLSDASIPTNNITYFGEKVREAPSPIFIGKDLYVFYDAYQKYFIGACRSSDGGRTFKSVKGINLPREVRHGTIFRVPTKILEGLLGEGARSKEQGASAEAAPSAAPDVSLLELKMGAEKLNGWGERVRITGEVTDLVRGENNVQLVLDDYHGRVIATVPLAGAMPEDWGVGATVHVTGTLTYNATDGSDFRLAVTRAADVDVLAPPLWWTPEKVQIATALGVFLALALLAGILLLMWAVRRLRIRLEKTIRAKHLEEVESEAARRERLRISHDLHDEFQQLLTGTMFQLNAGMNLLAGTGGAAAAKPHLESARQALQYTQAGLRTVLWTLREESEGPRKLLDLFRYAAGRMPHWTGRVYFNQVGEERPVTRKLSTSLLMILQEAIGNALKHGHAPSVAVELEYLEKSLKMHIINNGLTFDVTQPVASGHYGLESMRTRTEELGGNFSISSNDEMTEVTVEVPYGED